jgi:hypothetical protein
MEGVQNYNSCVFYRAIDYISAQLADDYFACIVAVASENTELQLWAKHFHKVTYHPAISYYTMLAVAIVL